MCACCVQLGEDRAPVYVIVLDHASRRGRQTVAIKELPANSTASQLHELLQLQRAAEQPNCAATHLLVRATTILAPPAIAWRPLLCSSTT